MENQVKTNKSAYASKRALIIFACAFLALVIVFAAVFGIIAAVRQSSYVMYYSSFGIDEGVCRYLSSVYKTTHIAALRSMGVRVYDTDKFWSSKDTDGVTYGEKLALATESYIKSIIAACVFFDNYTKLTDADEAAIDKAIIELTDYRANSDRALLGELLSVYGADASDLRVATEMLYKSSKAMSRVFGENGENMADYVSLCDEYYENYSHVQLLFVRTETAFVLDEEGNRVKDENGIDDMLRPLTDEEKATAAANISYIQQVCDGINGGTTTANMFSQLQEKYDQGDRSTHAGGYYFSSVSGFTKEFASELGEVTALALSLEEGKAGRTECSVGVCFVYKSVRTSGAYADSAYSDYFEDFYSLAAAELYTELLGSITEQIVVKESYGEIIHTEIPYNTDLFVRF